jgi:hypothetical protein
MKHKTSSILFFLAIASSVFSTLCFAEVYKWVDEHGKTHFSDKKIDGADQKVVAFDMVESEWTRFDIDVATRDVSLTSTEKKNIIDGINNVYEFFDRVLFFDIYKTVPVNILILKNKREYVNYLKQIGKARAAASYGVYIRSTNQIVVYIRKNREDTFKTIRHEVSHAVVDTIMPYSPAWLNEGLAEQMETLNRNNSGLYVESHTVNLTSVARALKTNRLSNISDFLKLPSIKWRHSLSDGQYYLQSQAGQFVYFLLSTRPNRSFVVRLMHKFSRGDRKLSYYLVDDNYIGGVKTMEIAWRNWVKQQSSQTITFF